MNEIDPTTNTSNGSVSSENNQPVVGDGSPQNPTRSPLLSSLLTSPVHRSTAHENQLSNGQQDKSNRSSVHGLMMPSPSAIVANPQYDESVAYLKKASQDSSLSSLKEVEPALNSHRNRIHNNLNELLQRNNNNKPSQDITSKSILENCLLKPSITKSSQSRPESQFYAAQKMNESDFHHGGSATSSSVLKFASHQEENRKVEPLKINLNREPIRTVIKIPQAHNYESSPTKLTMKPSASISISPTLSSSSHSSESSYETYNDVQQRASSIQVVPKLHLRTPLNHEQSELHIVPKLTITGLNSPGVGQNNVAETSPTMRDHSVNSILDGPGIIPKLTLKKDRDATSEGFYHLNHEASTIPKLHIKTNHHHHHHHQKAKEQPTVPKLTIKTTENETKAVVNSVVDEAIPKLLIKAQPKLTIKPVVRPSDDIVEAQEESIPKLTLKAVNNSTSFEKVVPKLVLKVPKEPDEKDIVSVPKASKPSKEVPKQPVKNSTETSEVKFSINRLIGAAPTETIEIDDDDDVTVEAGPADSSKEDEDLVCKPLEINTSIIKTIDSGQDSPRIILKINKTNNESTVTEVPPKLVTVNHNNKRSHLNDEREDEEAAKKPKLNEDDDEVIIINDSDASNDAQGKQNAVAKVQPEVEEVKENATATPAVTTGRSLRQRRNHEAGKVQKEEKQTPPAQQPVQAEQENSQQDSQCSESIDPLALSNDGTQNSNNSIDELVTPKRGRGRPKKAVLEKPALVSEESVSRDPLEIDLPPESTVESVVLPDNENSQSDDVKKGTPVSRGRGRGRGRLKRTVEVMKNGKTVQITLDGHDDDDSPSFSLYNRSLRGGFTGNKRTKSGRGARGGSKSMRSPFLTPERSKDGNFMTPNHSELKENNRKRLFTTPAIFEEDTRMSMSGNDFQTPFKSMEMHSNEESQSSILSSASNTIDGSSARKQKKKMEVCEPEGRTEFTVDMLAEYDWPQNESGKNRDTYMIQEQIAEYLGIKSFKRKYPDLIRRPVDMEERNHLFENGLASEKMCDLGLTAVYASEVLDIMCNDYPEKYEEYKRYQREKIFKHARLRLETAVVDRSQMQKDKAITSASEWNTRFNKDRRENRRCCMDLQNFLIQKPTPIRDYRTTPSAKHRSPYPVSLVPGQFSEYYEKYTPEQLACYPINTILVDFNKLQDYLKTHPDPYDSSSDSSSDSSDDENDKDESGDSSSTDSDSSSDSSNDDYEDPLCKVCSKTPFTNRYNQPEKFIKCSTCKNEAHPSCIEMSQRMYVRSLAYSWQCSSCKTCGKCRKSKDNKMLYCIQCDRGFHIYCLGLRNIPEGHYHCVNCTICSECGAKSPEGQFNPSLTQQQRQDLAMIAEWNHEFVVNPLTNIQEHKATLCLPCFRRHNQKKTDN